MCYNNGKDNGYMVKINKLKISYKRYEGILIPLALFFGFATDVLTFRFIEFTTSMIILFCHLLFTGVNIAVINYFKDKRTESKFTSFWNLFAPLFVQFSFGNLFSGFLIFYSQSGSFFASWPFLLVVAGLLIGNEIARRYNVGPSIQIGAYFFALFSYLNLVFPYTFKRLDLLVFLVSGFLALVIITLFIHHLSNYSKKVKEEAKKLKWTIAGVFLAMNFLYFANLIPPIPLTMQSSGVYHNIERTNDSYKVESEQCNNWDRCLFTRETRTISGDRGVIYFYSAIYAPAGMDMAVTHKWEKYNEDQSKWITKAVIPFDISGGRDIGFRWYSYYTVNPGLWRVSAQTQKGQTIGRESFYVVKNNNITKIIETI